MEIVYLTHDVKSGSGIMRAVWPAQWINKFTEHHARVYGIHEYAQLGFGDCMLNADVIVVHRVQPQLLGLLEMARQSKPDITFILDTDDYELGLFDTYYLSGFMGGYEDFARKVYNFVDGIICTSKPLVTMLGKEVDKPMTYIDNSFDMTLTHNHRPKHDSGGFKVVWGGGSSHYRDLEMLLRMDVLQDLCRKYPIDFFFHSLVSDKPGAIKFKYGAIHNAPTHRIDRYIDQIYNDADLAIVPLMTKRYDAAHDVVIKDDLNHCRSRLKLIEAGIGRVPVIASDVDTYNGWEGQVRLVENNYSQWYDAIETYYLNRELAKEHGEKNYETVNNHYTAIQTTEARIAFIQQIQETK